MFAHLHRELCRRCHCRVFIRTGLSLRHKGSFSSSSPFHSSSMGATIHHLLRSRRVPRSAADEIPFIARVHRDACEQGHHLSLTENFLLRVHIPSLLNPSPYRTHSGIGTSRSLSPAQRLRPHIHRPFSARIFPIPLMVTVHAPSWFILAKSSVLRHSLFSASFPHAQLFPSTTPVDPHIRSTVSTTSINTSEMLILCSYQRSSHRNCLFVD